MKHFFLKCILIALCPIVFLTSFAQRIDFTPLNIYSSSAGRIELAGKLGERIMTIQYSKVSDTVNFVWYDPNLTTIEKKTIIQPELNQAIHVGYFINGDTCFLVTQNKVGSTIRIGILGLDKFGQVCQTYKVLEEFKTEEKNPGAFTFQYFKQENAVLLSKWKLIPGTRKSGTLRIINSFGELASKQQIQTGYIDEGIDLDLFLYKNEAYAAMQLTSSEFYSGPKTILYKSSAGANYDPITIQHPDFLLGNLKFSVSPVTGELYLGGLSINKKSKRNGGIALLKINRVKSTDQFQTKLLDRSLFHSLYPRKKDIKKIFEDGIVLEKFEFSANGGIIAYVHKTVYRYEDLKNGKEYFPEYRTVNAGSPGDNLTASQNFDRMRNDMKNTPFGNSSVSSNSTDTNSSGIFSVVRLQPIDFGGVYEPPTASQTTGTVDYFKNYKSLVCTNDLLTMEESVGVMKSKEFSRSKQSMRSMSLTIVNSLNDYEFVSLQYPFSREHIIFQGRMSSISNLSSMALFPKKFLPFYGEGVVIYAGYRKLATLYLNRETGDVGIAMLSW